ncbi:MAG: hypothetical protein KatS3mg105_1162 [Gemmatales bacterium]|nr:MAG: hypothetical protein KatS3mg105_1162 [Gemmatales bacterium]
MRTLSFLVVAGVLVLTANKATAQVEPIKVIELKRTEPVLYDKDIEPIFVKKCLYCHSGNVKEGKFDMGTYESLMKGGKRGKAIIPGNSKKSLLVQLAGKTKSPRMPPRKEKPLTPEELALIKLWIDQGAKAPTGVRVRPKPVLTLLPSNINPVRSLAISPDNSAVVAGRANQIHVYDAGSGAYIRSLVNPELKTPDNKPIQGAHMAIVEALAYSPDSKYLASGSFQEVIIWDAQTGTIKHKLTGFADRVVALAFSPDGKLLATGGGPPTENGEVKVFEVATGKLVTDIKDPTNGHSDQVFGVCFSPDSKMIASCGADKFVKIFEIPSGKFIKALEGHTHHVLDVGWRFDGKVLASCGADNVIKVWDFEKGEQTRTINTGFSKQITRLMFVGKSSDVLACSGDGTAKMFNVDRGNAVRTFTGAKDFLYAIGSDATGKVIATGGEEGLVRVYNGANGQLLKTLAPPGAEPEKDKK